MYLPSLIIVGIECFCHNPAGTGVGAEVLEGFTTLIWMQLRPGLDRQRLIQELKLLDPYMLLNLRKLK